MALILDKFLSDKKNATCGKTYPIGKDRVEINAVRLCELRRTAFFFAWLAFRLIPAWFSEMRASMRLNLRRVVGAVARYKHFRSANMQIRRLYFY